MAKIANPPRIRGGRVGHVLQPNVVSMSLVPARAREPCARPGSDACRGAEHLGSLERSDNIELSARAAGYLQRAQARSGHLSLNEIGGGFIASRLTLAYKSRNRLGGTCRYRLERLAGSPRSSWR